MKRLGGLCRDCKHFDQNEENSDGVCRESSPQVSILMTQQTHPISRQQMMVPQVVANFPPVGPECWCGKWGKQLSLSMN